jgi:hypothetical protein
MNFKLGWGRKTGARQRTKEQEIHFEILTRESLQNDIETVSNEFWIWVADQKRVSAGDEGNYTNQ